MKAMDDMADEPVDLGKWVQWYAFDVIGMVSFQRMFGFLEHREDPNSMLDTLEMMPKYGTIVGEVPFLHQYLLGNKAVNRLMGQSAAWNALDPMPRINKVAFASKVYRMSSLTES